MMHMIQGWTGLRAAVIALGLVAWTATGATAAPLFYTTSGQVTPTTGVTGTNVVSFDPLSSGNSVDLSTGKSNVSLGNFVIASPGTGATTNYDMTPFQISFLPAAYGSTPISSDPPVVISGVLNGAVSGPSSSTGTATNSTVVATFSPVPNGLISLGTDSNGNSNGTGTFNLPTTTLLLAPSSTNGGLTSAQGLVTLNAPPPGS